MIVIKSILLAPEVIIGTTPPAQYNFVVVDAVFEKVTTRPPILSCLNLTI
jgi:hypothetical protein